MELRFAQRRLSTSPPPPLSLLAHVTGLSELARVLQEVFVRYKVQQEVQSHSWARQSVAKSFSSGLRGPLCCGLGGASRDNTFTQAVNNTYPLPDRPQAPAPLIRNPGAEMPFSATRCLHWFPSGWFSKAKRQGRSRCPILALRCYSIKLGHQGWLPGLVTPVPLWEGLHAWFNALLLLSWNSL